jgi:hypothetical protein
MTLIILIRVFFVRYEKFKRFQGFKSPPGLLRSDGVSEVGTRIARFVMGFRKSDFLQLISILHLKNLLNLWNFLNLWNSDKKKEEQSSSFYYCCYEAQLVNCFQPHVLLKCIIIESFFFHAFDILGCYTCCFHGCDLFKIDVFETDCFK